MRVFLFVILSALSAGCASPQPAVEESRVNRIVAEQCRIHTSAERPDETRDCTAIEQVKFLFDGITVGKSTIADLYVLGFGGMNTTTETVSSTWIPFRLTNRTDGGMELLDEATQSCLKTSGQCKLVIFSDRYRSVRGANNIAKRITKIKQIDIGSNWFWEAYFVVELLCEEQCVEHHLPRAIVRAKHFNEKESPPSIQKSEWDVLNSKINPPDPW